jgi:malate dehydrogenase (quinone)
MSHTTIIDRPDVILIGSGVMSANLGAMLKSLEPSLRLQMYEASAQLAQESSYGWNNAGTGHAGICELSYTPHRLPDGSVPVAKAIEIFEQFEHSKQFWSYALRQGMLDNPREFINAVPHMSFVHGAEQVDFLRARHRAMAAHHFFTDMAYSTERDTIASWAPLLVAGRSEMPIAATKMEQGTDVNFGALSKKLLTWLAQREGAGVACAHRVIDLNETATGWEVVVKNIKTQAIHRNHARFVFVGAGGGSLPLLQKSGIPESKGLGGFPIGGQWLVCDNPEVVKQHQAKVYGQALKTAPTMAVPHLDTRILDGKKTLLFGPFASWTTKFLHQQGSYADLPLSVKPDNLATLLKIGIHNLGLVRYLMQQGTQSMADRLNVLQIFYPGAQARDWKLVDAGIRVQAIKKTDGEAGIVHYGTEVITNQARSISALLGASPGASVSVSVMLQVIKTCLPHLLESNSGRAQLKEMIPTYHDNIKDPAHASLFREVSAATNQTLGLS